MKKSINTSIVYFVLALCAGVFYREFKKFNGFTGVTTLSVIHTHLFILGMFFFLIFALFQKNFPKIKDNTKVNKFYILYNVSLILFTLTLFVRGIVQVLDFHLSSALNASLSGIAGISHILITISLIMFFMILKDTIKENA